MALLGGGSGIASNLLGGASGMDLLRGKGLSGALPTKMGRSPMDIYNYFTEKGVGMDRLKDYAKIFDPASAVTSGGDDSSPIINNIVKQMQNKEITVEQGTKAIQKCFQKNQKNLD